MIQTSVNGVINMVIRGNKNNIHEQNRYDDRFQIS